MNRTKPWFEEWFNSPYYHILYGRRDQNEAKHFINNLLNHLNPDPNDEFLDLACGKGRHALEISNKGFQVTGIDLSVNSINEAKKLETSQLEFHVGDMRKVHFPNRFSYVFNLFTSFGYFDTIAEQKLSLDAVNQQLKKGGLFVLDYFNAYKVEQETQQSSTVEIEMQGIVFRTKKRLSRQFVSKEIQFTDKGKEHSFYEHVWRLNLTDFEDLLKKSDFRIQTIFGDYELNKFDRDLSDRLIIVAQKQ